jgi:hypothetical protein
MGFGTGFFLGMMASSGGTDADPAGCLFGFEMTLISGTLGLLYESWWIFFLSVTALFILVRIKYFLLPLLVILTGFWGLGAYSICEREGLNFSDKSLITLLTLVLVGLGHYTMWGRLKGAMKSFRNPPC